MRLKVIILKGLPGSGKTTYAKNLQAKFPGGFVRINNDELREMAFGDRWSKQKESFVVRSRNEIIRASLVEGMSVIVDNTNLNPFHEKDIRNVVGDEVEVELVDLTNVPLEECIRRDKGRKPVVGEKIIREMYDKFLKNG